MKAKPWIAAICLLWGAGAIADDVVNERLPKQGNEQGQVVYNANCAACHQPNGTACRARFRRWPARTS